MYALPAWGDDEMAARHKPTPFTIRIITALPLLLAATVAAMTPRKPVTLEPGLAYVHITSSTDPSAIVNALSDHPSYRLQYLGPVGELDGEHIFQVQNVCAEAVKRDELDGDVLGAVKRIEGVKGASVLESKQRAKRDEF